ARGQLVAQVFQDFGPRTDKNDTMLATASCKSGVFGKEAITWVDSVDGMFLCQGDDGFNVEIGSQRFTFLADLISFVSLEAMQRKSIFVRVDRNRSYA